MLLLVISCVYGKESFLFCFPYGVRVGVVRTVSNGLWLTGLDEHLGEAEVDDLGLELRVN